MESCYTEVAQLRPVPRRRARPSLGTGPGQTEVTPAGDTYVNHRALAHGQHLHHHEERRPDRRPRPARSLAAPARRMPVERPVVSRRSTFARRLPKSSRDQDDPDAARRARLHHHRGRRRGHDPARRRARRADPARRREPGDRADQGARGRDQRRPRGYRGGARGALSRPHARGLRDAAARPARARRRLRDHARLAAQAPQRDLHADPVGLLRRRRHAHHRRLRRPHRRLLLRRLDDDRHAGQQPGRLQAGLHPRHLEGRRARRSRRARRPSSTTRAAPSRPRSGRCGQARAPTRPTP